MLWFWLKCLSPTMSHVSLHSSVCLYFIFHTFFCVICHLLCLFFQPHHSSRPQCGVSDASRLLWPSFKSSRGSSLKVQFPSSGYGNLSFLAMTIGLSEMFSICGLTFLRCADTSSLPTDDRRKLKTDDVWEGHCTGTQVDRQR